MKFPGVEALTAQVRADMAEAAAAAPGPTGGVIA